MSSLTNMTHTTDDKPLAVVTGASSGIGLELARQFADNGFDVLVSAEDPGIEAAAHRLRETGAFVDTELADDLEVISLNVTSSVHLAKRLVRDMVDHGAAGRLLFTSSIASTMPGSYQAVYNASKSFVQSFAEVLRDELKDTGAWRSRTTRRG